MDIDGDGDTDVLSGSFPGGLYLFRRGEDGSFEKGQTLKDADGKEINTGSASTVFAHDWDADGDLDLITGNISGEVHLVANEGTRTEPAYGKAVKLDVDRDLKSRHGDSGAIVADWDADGLPDLIVAMGDGSVVWFRNTGTREEPQLARGEELVPQSPFGFDLNKARPDKGQWGARVKVHAVDFNGDGRLDLLLGDRSGAPPADAELTDKQKQTLEEAKRRVDEVRRQLSRARSKLQRLQRNARRSKPARRTPGKDEEAGTSRTADELKQAREDYTKLSREYSSLLQQIRRLEPRPVRHGFVWLFERKAAAEVAGR